MSITALKLLNLKADLTHVRDKFYLLSVDCDYLTEKDEECYCGHPNKPPVVEPNFCPCRFKNCPYIQGD